MNKIVILKSVKVCVKVRKDWVNYKVSTRWSGGLSEVDVDFDTAGDSNGGDFLHLGSSAFEVNISLEDGHFPVVPGFWTLTAWSSSAADSQMFIWKSDWTSDFNATVLGISD